jgi:hypothetical protein
MYEQAGREEEEQHERKKRTREPSARQSLRNIAAETD